MAQWMGQFTGRTHESKVKAIEDSLAKAVDAFRAADESSREAKQKSVMKLCERLLSARHKAIKARISKLSETRSLDNDSKKTQKLVECERKLAEGGVEEILVEFKIQGLIRINK